MNLILLAFAASIGFASEWSIKDEKLDFHHGTLEYSNRSACAKKNQSPTKSVFLMVDNTNIARSVFRLAKLKNLDTVTLTNLGVEKLRYTVTTLIQQISSKLLSGQLAFVDDKKLNHDDYLASNWRLSSPVKSRPHINCKIIKKFSTLHSHLNVSRPDRVLMEEMAKELNHLFDFVTSCDDFSSITQPEVALYQFDLYPGGDFQQKGFAFWYSLKVYLSWAFRHSTEMKELAEPFDFLFQSANLEEMILFFSNGCESIAPPQCSDSYIGMEKLRGFTQLAEKMSWEESDYTVPIPDKTPDDLFSKPLPVMSDDLLNLGYFKNADEWLLNFRDNFLRARGYNKIRLSKAMMQLSLVEQAVDPTSIGIRIQKDIATLTELQRHELYYLCSEYNVATDKDLSFIRKNLWQLKQIKVFDDLLLGITEKKMDDFFQYFEKISQDVNQICGDLKQKEVWDNEFQLNQEGYAPWYQQLVFEKKYGLKENLALGFVANEYPYLKIHDGDILCHSGIHCARTILDSMLSLSAISQNFSALIPESTIPASNIANPFGARQACGAYDPWAKRNKIIFDFFQDIAQAAVFGYLPTPVYVAASLDPKRVVSFESLIKEGQVHYDPKFDHHRLKLSLIADLGPLIGVPCSVSISGTKLNPFEYYMFNGISFSACRERSKTDMVIQSGEDQQQESQYKQICGACAINLQTITSSASVINPIFRMSFFLLKGVTRLFSQLKDPDDLSHSWSLSPQQVALSYHYHGEITKSCARSLLKGRNCLDKPCEKKMIENFTSQYHGTPQSTDFSCLRGEGTLKIKECETPIFLSGRRHLEIQTDCALKRRDH